MKVKFIKYLKENELLVEVLEDCDLFKKKTPVIIDPFVNREDFDFSEINRYELVDPYFQGTCVLFKKIKTL